MGLADFPSTYKGECSHSSNTLLEKTIHCSIDIECLQRKHAREAIIGKYLLKEDTVKCVPCQVHEIG